VKISTSNVPIANTVTDVPGTITITSSDGSVSYLPNSSDSDATATFHVHGHTTAAMPKKPYHVKLNTSLDLLQAMGYHCPYVTGSGKATCDKSKSYILLANYDDKTLLRDWSASALANAIPIGGAFLNSAANSPSPSGTSALMPWAPHSLFVELYVNDVYEGNYQLIEEVKVDSHRVNINELAATDITDNITGGYLLEIDQTQGEVFNFVTPNGVYLGVVDPDFSPDPEVPEQTAYISNYMLAADTALFGSNYRDPTLGWRGHFDEASAVNFYIVNELMGNLDGADFQSSDYLYKDKSNPLIYMGPVWDFDVSSGNVNYDPSVNPLVPMMSVRAPWYRQLFTDPGFKADVAAQWNALKNGGILASWLASIAQQAQALQVSQANNFTRWPMLGIMVWPNAQAAGSYDAEVSYLLNWLNLRIGYLDSEFNSKAETSITLSLPKGTLQSGNPVTLSASVSGASNPTGAVYFLANGVVLGSSSLDGSGHVQLTLQALPAGSDTLEAVYAGDATNGLSYSIAAANVLPAAGTTLH
jgi:CotH kinase protein/Bacterial Ig-like domain (group 3)